MDTATGTSSTPRQIVPRNASTDISLRCQPFPTSLTQVAFAGRAIINTGGCSQRKSKSPGIDGADCSTQGVQHGGIGNTVGKSGKLKDVFVSGSPVILAAAVPLEEAIASGMNYGIRNSVAAGSGNTHGRVCHVVHCKEAAFGNMDGYPTVPLCDAHLNDNRRRLRTNADKIKANRKALEENVCEYPECTKKPRYSPIKGGPVRACKHHKKAGMFSIRRGQILFAVHDGHALRSAPFSSMSRTPEGNGEMQRLSVTNGQITQLKRPVEALQIQPKKLTSRPSTPVEVPGGKSGALKRKATAAAPNATHTGSPAPRSVHTSPTLRSSKLSHITEMVPSAEMNVLQKERGKAMAEASATGRRPRVPSRKALEASGKLDNDGVQWMTKDMYKAEVKLRKELRERRKEEAAAKMKVDQKLDTLKVRIKVDDPVDVDRAGKSAGGGYTGRGDTSIRGWEKQNLASITLRRRTWSAVKLSQVGAQGQASIAEQSKGQAEVVGSGEGGSRKRSKTVTEE